MPIRKVLILIFISAQIVSCGVKVTAERKGIQDAPQDPVQKPDPIENTSKHYTYYMNAENTKESFYILKVKTHKNGADVKVDSFPKRFKGSFFFKINILHFFFDKRVSQKDCDEVKIIALSSKNLVDNKKFVRDWTPVMINMDSQINFLKAGFENSVKKFVADKLGIDWTNVSFNH